MPETPETDNRNGEKKESLSRERGPVLSRILFPAAVILIAGFGFYLRVANLGSVQHFQGDQGRDYLEVMRWLKEGKWPLLGPLRAVGDYNIGPGWYYTLAPFLWITGFHPSAGAMTTSAIGMSAALLALGWVLATTGSRTAALAVYCFLALAPQSIDHDRILMNPTPLLFATVALAFLLQRFPKHALSSLALIAALFLILPHWHTAAVFPMAAAVPPLAYLAWKERTRLLHTPRKEVLAYGVPIVLWAGLLYTPPLIHECKTPSGNLRTYVARSFQSQVRKPPAEMSLPAKAAKASVRLRNFWGLFLVGPDIARSPLGKAVVGAALVLVFLSSALVLLKTRNAPSVVFLLLLAVLSWVTLAVHGASLYDYCFGPVLPVPCLLFGWLAGRSFQVRGFGKWVGGAMVAVALAVVCYQTPDAWEIPRGRIWYGTVFDSTQRIARRIADRAGGRSSSVLLLEPGNYSAHFHYLLWRSGNRPANRDYYSSRITRAEFGEALYLILPRALRDWPVNTAELSNPQSVTQEFLEYARLVLIPVDAIPPHAQGLEFQVLAKKIEVRLLE